MKTINIGILGLGTVGGGTINVLQKNALEIERRLGAKINVVIAAVQNKQQQRICDVSEITLTDKPEEVVQHPDVDIVVETIGGNDTAKDLVVAAIKNGKHVVTANKALIALHGNDLFKLADKHATSILYEAAVAGGIPIIKILREGMSGNKIELIAGIINGTTNYILTEMQNRSCNFAEALQQAQQLGYAEADPTFDIEGTDAAHKLSILAAIAFGIPLQPEKIYTEGITQITLDDIKYAQELGYCIKHMGFAAPTSSGLELRVHPVLIPQTKLIANVDGVMNAVLVKGNAVGSTLHYGAGAGAEPTASAIVADIIDLARNKLAANDHTQATSAVPALAFQDQSISDKLIESSENFENPYYLRVMVKDKSGVLSHLSSQLAEMNISIDAITQKKPKPNASKVSVIILTQRIKEQKICDAVRHIEAIAEVCDPVTLIRIENLN